MARHRCSDAGPTKKGGTMRIKRGDAVLGAGALAACGLGRAAAQAADLVIYSAYEDGQIGPLATEFTKANPSIKVRHFHQPGEELLGTLTLELQAGQGRADVVGLNEASLLILDEKLSALDPYSAAGQDKLMPGMGDPRSRFTPAFVNLYLIHYNIKALQAVGVPSR